MFSSCCRSTVHVALARRLYIIYTSYINYISIDKLNHLLRVHVCEFSLFLLFYISKMFLNYFPFLKVIRLN